jgi:uncharacterized protein (TIGR01319 family)
VLATDCGSTTTKAILFEKTVDGWRATHRGEAPTTVEKPVADVTIGARNAFSEVQETSGIKILRENAAADENPLVLRGADGGDGVDLYVSTSSAGGGLQMVVLGVVGSMTTQSAERAALGAGAIVMDTVSIDDGREPFEQVQRIRHVKPDIVLIAGGTDGGTATHPLELAETILQADPPPRFGDTLRLPVIYAANSAVQEQARKLLEEKFEFTAVENLRPSLDVENLKPARDAIHEIFLHHVMSHAPGYRKLLSWSPVPIIPTPAAFGEMVQQAARSANVQVLAVDIGGATTDVFSVFASPETEMGPGAEVFNRTVSANLGMSYSIANVLIEAGVEGIRRWLPFTVPDTELRDRLRNKMIRPTSIPQTKEDLILEQAVCREALRLALVHHRRLATGLKGTQKRRTIGDLFRQEEEESLVDMMRLDLIIGSGGVLSHAPDRRSAAFMLLDGYEPEGITRLAVDSVFMMPHLGVFAQVHGDAAHEIFLRDCIVDLGTAVAARGRTRAGEELATVLFQSKEHSIREGEITVIPFHGKEEIVIRPAARTADFGAGPGKEVRAEITGGEAGLILDGRLRPLKFSTEKKSQLREVREWYSRFGLAVQ